MAKSSAKTEALWSLLVHAYYTGDFARHNFSLLSVCSSGDPVEINLNAPFVGDHDYVSVVGSINGLVCLSLCIEATSFVLWNPATRKHFRILNPRLSLGAEERVSAGFAYDDKTDCYKVIRIFHTKDYESIPCPVRVEFYSTGTSTWRTGQAVDFPLLVNYNSCGNVVHGCPYWYAHKPNFASQVLMWFDASEDALRFRALQPVWPSILMTCLGGAEEQLPFAFAFHTFGD